MFDWLMWFTHMENTKVLALVMFFVFFVLILLYVYLGKERSARLESYRFIPLDDDDHKDGETSADRKVKKDGRAEDE
jgi:cbb3-type cytochrome oxidase subunit 3